MTKRSILGGVIFMTLIGWLVSTSALPKKIQGSGMIQSISTDTWGVNMTWNPLRPFADRTFRLSSVTEEFQHDGMKVQIRASITDVIGGGKWDVVVTPESITKQ